MKPDSTKHHFFHSRSVFLPPSLSGTLFFLFIVFFFAHIKRLQNSLNASTPPFVAGHNGDTWMWHRESIQTAPSERARLTSLIDSCRWRLVEWRNEKILQLRNLCFLRCFLHNCFFHCPFLRPRARAHASALNRLSRWFLLFGRGRKQLEVTR